LISLQTGTLPAALILKQEALHASALKFPDKTRMVEMEVGDYCPLDLIKSSPFKA